jgi:hypothetical protein
MGCRFRASTGWYAVRPSISAFAQYRPSIHEALPRFNPAYHVAAFIQARTRLPCTVHGPEGRNHSITARSRAADSNPPSRSSNSVVSQSRSGTGKGETLEPYSGGGDIKSPAGPVGQFDRVPESGL